MPVATSYTEGITFSEILVGEVALAMHNLILLLERYKCFKRTASFICYVGTKTSYEYLNIFTNVFAAP